MARTLQIVIDCADPGWLAPFWAAALGYKMEPPPEGYGTWDEALLAFGVPESDWNSRSAIVDPDGVGARVFFQRVPEPKAGKNRLHLDVRATQRGTSMQIRQAAVDAEASRLLGLGASKVRLVAEGPDYFRVMLDPEGNEFCIT